MHTRPRLRHHTNPKNPAKSRFLSRETLNAGQTTLTTDQKVGSSNLSGRAAQRCRSEPLACTTAFWSVASRQPRGRPPLQT